MKIGEKVGMYIKERFGEGSELLGIEPIGKGIHGEAFLVRFRSAYEERRLIMKTLFPSGFGHDHFSDRAQVLLLANANYNALPRHVQSVDVVGETADRLVSVGDAHEFYIFMAEAGGRSYFHDLNAVLERGALTTEDRERAKALGAYIAGLHALKYVGEDARTLYRRRIRDLIGHGECIMGIVDAYDAATFAEDRELVRYAAESLAWWGKIRDRCERLARVHGDYHPGNIRFLDGDFMLLDRSRGSWGEPADDFSCLMVNYVHYALKERGRFEGPFADLCRSFSESYLEATRDEAVFEVMQPFFAFRILVVANPNFYPDDAWPIKRKLLELGRTVLSVERFDLDDIPSYLRGK